MKFDSFTQLIEVIKTHRQFDNEIKIKRLKKEMQILSNYENPSTTIQQIELTSIGIELLVNFLLNKVKNKFRQSYYVYKMILDFEYPFNRPIVYFMKKDSPYAQCKDLLEILLEGSNWGPSLMLTHFLDRLQTISENIRQSNAFESKSMYRIGQNYRKSLLQSMQIKLFQVEEYSWKYLIKSTKKRYLGLTNETLFLFSLQKDNQNIALDFWKPINQITTAKASVSSNKKFNLQISYAEEQKETILYFGGQQKIETILGYLNPIEMIERKVSQIEKNVASIQKSKYWNDNNDMIRDFTQLIEHYSLKDPTKSERYIKLMKQLIAKFYEAGIKEEKVEQKKNQYQVQKEEIQT